jgi:hypothetical protein
MKCIKYLSLFLLLNCNNHKQNESPEITTDMILQNDSLKALNRAVVAFKEDVSSAIDSANKYNLKSISDTCLKFIYTLNGSDTLRNSNNLTIRQIAIYLTQVKQIKGPLFKLEYSFFINDSIPIWPELVYGRGSVFHTFDVDTTTKSIIKAYFGQHYSYTSGKDITSLYHNILNNDSLTASIYSNKSKLHPIYLKLLY